MAATFEAKVEALTTLDITDSSTPNQGQLSEWLTEAAREIINILPNSFSQFCTGSSALPQAGSSEFSINTSRNIGKVLYVTRTEEGTVFPCRVISALHKGFAADTTNIIHYATANDPVYWVTSSDSSDTAAASVLEVFPTPTSGNPAHVYYTYYPDIAYSEEFATNFPNTADHLLVLYAACRALLAKIASLNIPPLLDGSAVDLTDMQEITGGQLAHDADFDDFEKWFVALGEMIEDDEDIELASAQIQKINSFIATYNLQLQSSLSEIQKHMQVFQALKQDYVMGLGSLGAQTKGGKR